MAAERRAQMQDALGQVPKHARDQWASAFNEFDVSKNGFITPDELEQSMKKMKMVPAQGEVAAMIAAVDLDADNAISFEEFELMMVAAGRTGGGANLGFSHVVNRFIQMSVIADLIASECNGFVERFFAAHRDEFASLHSPDEHPSARHDAFKIPKDFPDEHPHAWHDTFKIFKEEAELTVQNVLVLWGAAKTRDFDEEFLEQVAANDLLENFLKLTEYPAFVAKMSQTLEAGAGLGGPPAGETPRPETPSGCRHTQQKLADIDRKLAALDGQRNRLLAERRRLVGCEIQPVTTAALKSELTRRRWADDVGLD